MINSLLWIFIILNGIGVIRSESEVFSIMHLVSLLCSVAVLQLYNGLDYVGILLVIVYVGAIGVLFIFVMMMIEVKEEVEVFIWNGKFWMAVSIGVLMLRLYSIEQLEVSSVLPIVVSLELMGLLDEVSLVKEIGEAMYNQLFESVIIIGLILLVCLIGCLEIIV